MLRCPATKCDYHIAVCLFCCLAPSMLRPCNCAHVGTTLTCYQNVLILPSCMNTSETVNTRPTICTNLWISAYHPYPTFKFPRIRCVAGCVAPPTLWMTCVPFCDTWNHSPSKKASRRRLFNTNDSGSYFRGAWYKIHLSHQLQWLRFCNLGPYTNTGMCVSLQQMIITILNHRKIQQI